MPMEYAARAGAEARAPAFFQKDSTVTGVRCPESMGVGAALGRPTSLFAAGALAVVDD